MLNVMRKIFTFITALTMGAMITANAAAVGDVFTIDGVQYKVTSVASGAEKVSVPVQDYASASLVIPAKVTYDAVEYTVYMVEQNAFKNNKIITSLDVAASVISSWAFEACSNLADVTLREGVTTLYRDAFEGFAATSITLPASLVEIDEYGYYCPFPDNQLESFVVAAGNPHLVVGEDGALYNKERTRIYAFPHNFSKKFKEIPSTVEIIYDDVFSDCTNISDTIIIPATLQRAQSFRRCSSIKCVILESNSMNVSNCFTYCPELEEIIIGKNVTQLGQLLFYGCCNVRKITVLSETMPNWQYGTNTSWPIFGYYSYCGGSTTPFTDAKVYVHCGQSDTYKADENKWANFTNIIDTLLYDIDVTAANATVVLSDTTDCNKVTITVTPDPGYAFVNWDNGVTTASFDCTVTSDTAITANIKKILQPGDHFRCNTVEGVSMLFTVLVNSAGDKQVKVGQYWAPSPGTGSNAIDKATAGEVTIPDSAVYYDEKFLVSQIDGFAFYGCNSVTALHIPNTIAEIGVYGVGDMSSITEVNIPENENFFRTGRSNFAYMSQLTSITIPGNIQYLDYATFSFNPLLEEINGWDPSKIKRMGRIQWENSPKIYADETYVQRDGDGCYYMGDIIIRMPNSVSITVKEGTRVVMGGGGLLACQHIEFPSTIEAMGSGSIYNLPLLETCTIKAVTPPLIYDSYEVITEFNANALRQYPSSSYPQYGSTPETVKYYVPKEAVATYKANDKWNMLDIRPIGGWTVAFVDHNGDTIASEQVEQGNRPASIPTSVPTYYDTHMHQFDNAWDTTLVGIGDTLYSAKYTTEDLPKFYVNFYKTEADALAQTSRLTRVQKTYGESAVSAAAQVVEDRIEAVPCEQVTGWNGGDLTSVKSDLHVWPVWGVGKYKVTFFDPIADANIAVREDIECTDLVEAPTAPEHAGYTFKGWDSDAWKDTDALTADLLIKAIYDTATGVENVQNADGCTQKLLRNGQLLILRNGKVYNATGVRVE